MPELEGYRYRGARALVLLQERHLREFLVTWRHARAAGVKLPATDNLHYASLETVLRHVLSAAHGYLTWICEKLELPEPELPALPELHEIEEQADRYASELLAGWRLPLRDLPRECFRGRTYTSRWGEEFTIEAMLEHAVMHPIRHSFQLRELMGE